MSNKIENGDQVRLPTEKEAVILGMMVSEPDKEQYAWDMVRKSDGEIGENSVYVILTRMVARGLLDDRVETKGEAHRGARRRLYKVTGHGQRAYSALVASRAIMTGDEFAFASVLVGADKTNRES